GHAHGGVRTDSGGDQGEGVSRLWDRARDGAARTSGFARRVRLRDAGTGEESDREQQDRGGYERERIADADAVELALQELRERQGGEDSSGEAEGREAEAFAQNHAADGARSRAEGDANSELLRAAGDGVRDDAEDSRSGEQQRDDTEKTEQPGAEPGLSDGRGDGIRKAPGIGDGKILVDALHD